MLGTVSAKDDSILKHATQAAATAGGSAIVVVGDKAFTDAGIDIQPRWLKDARIPDPRAASAADHRLDHPDQVKPTEPVTRTIVVNELVGIVIRWKLR